jgi:hypothetical protein
MGVLLGILAVLVFAGVLFVLLREFLKDADPS